MASRNSKRVSTVVSYVQESSFSVSSMSASGGIRTSQFRSLTSSPFTLAFENDSPRWISGSEVVFKTPKSPSPAKTRRRTEVTNYQKSAGRQSTTSPAFKVPSLSFGSPPGVKTRSRRSSMYVSGQKKSVQSKDTSIKKQSTAKQGSGVKRAGKMASTSKGTSSKLTAEKVFLSDISSDVNLSRGSKKVQKGVSVAKATTQKVHSASRKSNAIEKAVKSPVSAVNNADAVGRSGRSISRKQPAKAKSPTKGVARRSFGQAKSTANAKEVRKTERDESVTSKRKEHKTSRASSSKKASARKTRGGRQAVRSEEIVSASPDLEELSITKINRSKGKTQVKKKSLPKSPARTPVTLKMSAKKSAKRMTAKTPAQSKSLTKISPRSSTRSRSVTMKSGKSANQQKLSSARSVSQSKRSQQVKKQLNYSNSNVEEIVNVTELDGMSATPKSRGRSTRTGSGPASSGKQRKSKSPSQKKSGKASSPKKRSVSPVKQKAASLSPQRKLRKSASSSADKKGQKYSSTKIEEMAASGLDKVDATPKSAEKGKKTRKGAEVPPSGRQRKSRSLSQKRGRTSSTSPKKKSSSPAHKKATSPSPVRKLRGTKSTSADKKKLQYPVSDAEELAGDSVDAAPKSAQVRNSSRRNTAQIRTGKQSRSRSHSKKRDGKPSLSPKKKSASPFQKKTVSPSPQRRRRKQKFSSGKREILLKGSPVLDYMEYSDEDTEEIIDVTGYDSIDTTLSSSKIDKTKGKGARRSSSGKQRKSLSASPKRSSKTSANERKSLSPKQSIELSLRYEHKKSLSHTPRRRRTSSLVKKKSLSSQQSDGQLSSEKHGKSISPSPKRGRKSSPRRGKSLSSKQSSEVSPAREEGKPRSSPKTRKSLSPAKKKPLSAKQKSPSSSLSSRSSRKRSGTLIVQKETAVLTETPKSVKRTRSKGGDDEPASKKKRSSASKSEKNTPKSPLGRKQKSSPKKKVSPKTVADDVLNVIQTSTSQAESTPRKSQSTLANKKKKSLSPTSKKKKSLSPRVKKTSSPSLSKSSRRLIRSSTNQKVNVDVAVSDMTELKKTQVAVKRMRSGGKSDEATPSKKQRITKSPLQRKTQKSPAAARQQTLSPRERKVQKLGSSKKDRISQSFVTMVTDVSPKQSIEILNQSKTTKQSPKKGQRKSLSSTKSPKSRLSVTQVVSAAARAKETITPSPSKKMIHRKSPRQSLGKKIEKVSPRKSAKNESVVTERVLKITLERPTKDSAQHVKETPSPKRIAVASASRKMGVSHLRRSQQTPSPVRNLKAGSSGKQADSSYSRRALAQKSIVASPAQKTSVSYSFSRRLIDKPSPAKRLASARSPQKTEISYSKAAQNIPSPAKGLASARSSQKSEISYSRAAQNIPSPARKLTSPPSVKANDSIYSRASRQTSSPARKLTSVALAQRTDQLYSRAGRRTPSPVRKLTMPSPSQRTEVSYTRYSRNSPIPTVKVTPASPTRVLDINYSRPDRGTPLSTKTAMATLSPPSPLTGLSRYDRARLLKFDEERVPFSSPDRYQVITAQTNSVRQIQKSVVTSGASAGTLEELQRVTQAVESRQEESEEEEEEEEEEEKEESEAEESESEEEVYETERKQGRMEVYEKEEESDESVDYDGYTVHSQRCVIS